MFKAVREWWSSGRGKHTSRLFAFELVVVTLGVLLAQELQNWAQERGAIAHMEDERERARTELARVHLIALEWKAAAPCLDRRMTEIMAGRADSQTLVRPQLRSPNYAPPDDASLILIDRRYGHVEKTMLTNVAVGVANQRAITDAIVDEWGRFALIDPSNGVISPGDRAQARIAAANIKGQLRSASIVSDDILQRVAEIHVPAKGGNPRYGPASSCKAIWKSGRIDPPRGTS